jgi:hypothetical protein
VSREYDECRAEQALLSLEDKVELDQAIAILIELLQAGNAGSYGYDLYARRGAEEAAARMRLQPLQDQQVIRNISPVFFEAAWELCRRGLVRPGPEEMAIRLSRLAAILSPSLVGLLSQRWM